MTFWEAVKTCMVKKYAKTSGRASRSEYWWFQFFILVVIYILFVIAHIFKGKYNDIIFLVGFLFFVAMVIPSLCSEVRRLHDTGHSGLNILWYFVPYVGWIYVFILKCKESDFGENEYGPEPLVKRKGKITDVDL